MIKVNLTWLKALHLIALALHEEQDDVDTSFANDSCSQLEFKFLEKSVIAINQANSSNNKKSSLFSLAKSLTTKNSNHEETTTLTKLLTDIHSQVSNNNQVKLLIEWLLDYSHRLLKLKHKIDEQKQIIAGELISPESSLDDQTSKEKRKNQIAERSRAKVMAKLNKMQKSFMETYKDLYEETKSLSTSVDTSHLATAPLSNFSDSDIRH